MQLASLLARDGLDRETRILIGVAVATWHADWPQLVAWLEIAQHETRPRTGVEETLLQCVLFCGFPRVITAFEHLSKAWPASAAPTGGSLPDHERQAAGSALFQAIYGKNDDAVRAMLCSYHEELHDFVLEAAYGRILTRPKLPAKQRELIAVAVLAAQGQKRQFAGHARGASHLGASREELHEAVVTALGTTSQHAAGIDAWLALLR
jgi:AhpD family alkylhydroperoxidase